jgi:DtxR family Mn-dependent transcriptional regulator
VHDEADALEHHISARFEEKIDTLLNNPSYDPHGDPIPTKEGVLPKSASTPLSRITSKGTYIIDWVCHDDPGLLRYLEKLNLLPGVKIFILRKEPYGGPFILGVNNEQKMVGIEAAKNIYVLPIQ